MPPFTRSHARALRASAELSPLHRLTQQQDVSNQNRSANRSPELISNERVTRSQSRLRNPRESAAAASNPGPDGDGQRGANTYNLRDLNRRTTSGSRGTENRSDLNAATENQRNSNVGNMEGLNTGNTRETRASVNRRNLNADNMGGLNRTPNNRRNLNAPVVLREIDFSPFGRLVLFADGRVHAFRSDPPFASLSPSESGLSDESQASIGSTRDFLEALDAIHFVIMQLSSSPSSSSDGETYNSAVNEYIAERDRRRQYDANLESRNPLICNICLSPYRDREPTAVQCGHVYCRECIDRHLETQNPICLHCNAVMTRSSLVRLFP